ncbi:uncharacterized protein ISCGN_006178, partial [Ixodes scapularis]
MNKWHKYRKLKKDHEQLMADLQAASCKKPRTEGGLTGNAVSSDVARSDKPAAGGVFQSSEAGCSGDLEVQVQSASFEVSRSDVLASSSENDSSEDDTSDEYQSEESADHNSEPPNGSANPNAVTTSSSQPHELSACDELASIAGKHNMSHVCLNDVLAFCRRRGIAGLPKDARTVLCTERKSRLEQCDKFVHFGLEEGIRQSLQGCPIPKEIKLQGNIDGLPLFKSSQVSFWPLLCRITNLTPLPSPFMVSLYCGTGKPPNLEQYLYAFLEEARKLTVHGMVFKGSHITVSITAMVCDAPARSFIKQIVGHTGYHACERCSQRGLHLEGRMTFPDLHSPQRTNESFRSQEDEHHHTGTSPFESLDVDMVSWFPTEYMHLVCLGVMRRLLRNWVSQGFGRRLSRQQRENLNDLLRSCSKRFPSNFQRKPRGTEELDRWKATEFRSFLLYVGPVVLKHVLPNDQYRHFLMLHVAVRILVSPAHYEVYNGFARDLLRYFVQEFGTLYGAKQLVYNVHTLSHLAEQCLDHGPLDSFSAFPFESFL